MSQGTVSSSRWSSSEFGLYKYPQSEPEYDLPLKKETFCRKCVKFTLVTMITTVSIIVVCLLMFDFSVSLQTSDKNNFTVKLLHGEDVSVALPTSKLSLKSNKSNDKQQDVTISKQNISLVESTILESINNLSTVDSSLIESKTMSEKFYKDRAQNSDEFSSEYNQLYPMPFQKTERSDKNYPQLSNYRSANKMKNIEELVQYMEEQLFKDEKNARSSNPNRRIKFSGIYLHPRKSNNINVYERKMNRDRSKDDSKASPSEFTKPIDKALLDPFHLFKPNQPGDINLLAEKKFRFSPTFAQSRLNHHKVKQPIKYIPLQENSRCDNYNCNRQEPSYSDYGSSPDIEEYDFEEQPIVKSTSVSPNMKSSNKKRPLSVMLDIYPMEDQDEQTMAFPDHLKEPPAVYTTRSPPKMKFIPKPFYPSLYPYNTPPNPNYNYYSNYGYNPTGYNYNYNNYNRQITNRSPPFRPQNTLPPELQTRYGRKRNSTGENNPTQMLVHLNLYPRKKILKKNRSDETIYEVIDRKSKDDENDEDNGQRNSRTKSNFTDDDIILSSNFTKDARRAIIDAILSKYNRNPAEVPIVEDNVNMTVDEIQKGYSFKLPGPKPVKYDYPDGISEPAVRLLSLARIRKEKENLNQTLGKHFTKRNNDDTEIEFEVTATGAANDTEIFDEIVSNVNTTNVGESLAVFELNSTVSTIPTEQNSNKNNDTINFDEFIAVPILDI